MNRSIRQLYAASTIGFLLLIAMLGYWQVVAADDLNDRPGNPQTAQRERLVDRGRILSADGELLAASRATRVNGQRVFERVYPNGELAPHVVGYSAPSEGRTGLEDAYDQYLGGSYGAQPILTRLNLREKRGASIQTTLDSRIQGAANGALLGQRGAIVALRPSDGAVLAMASSPGFDLNQVLADFTAIPDEGAPLVNRATAGRYPPGSTFKVVTATAAIASGGFTPASSFDDTGRVDTPGGPIRNFGNDVFGEHNLIEALTRSINTTFARIGITLGAGGLGAAMSAYGFGARPPIDLPEEEVIASGRYRDGELLANDEAGEDTARLAIGQEQLVVTPLQMAMVAAGVANDGTIMQPYLVSSAADRGGDRVFEQQPREYSQSSSAAVAGDVTDMMTRVVREGTGVAAALSGLSVAGKTGTAETADADRNQAWFIGFAPAEAPTVAVAVVIEDTSSTGGAVAAPAAAAVMRAAIEVGG